MQEYSVGFLHNDTHVVLVRKNRPQWQAGLLNGVGGHVEEGEDPHTCMVREFYEETGVQVGPWWQFLTLEGAKARVHCFALYDRFDDYIDKVQTTTDEQIEVWHMADPALTVCTVPNLRWILPLMRQRDKYNPITISFHGDA